MFNWSEVHLSAMTCYKINTLSVFDIIDVNEEDQTVKLMFKIILEWQDYRMDVNRTKGDVTR